MCFLQIGLCWLLDFFFVCSLFYSSQTLTQHENKEIGKDALSYQQKASENQKDLKNTDPRSGMGQPTSN